MSHAESHGVKKERVLLIEDDAEMRAMLTEVLADEGYRVTECADAYEWIEACSACESPDAAPKYDIVVSDIKMPGVSGLALLEGLRGSRRNPPTILVTAFGDAATHERAMKLGAVAVLDKPFAIEDLLGEVQKVLGTRTGQSKGTASTGNRGQGTERL